MTFLFDTGTDFSWVHAGLFQHVKKSPIHLDLPNFSGDYIAQDLEGNFEDAPVIEAGGVIGNDFLWGPPIQLRYYPNPSVTIGDGPCDPKEMAKHNYAEIRQDQNALKPISEWLKDRAGGLHIPALVGQVDDIGPIPVLIDTGFAEYNDIGAIAVNKAMLSYLTGKGVKFKASRE